MRSDLVPWGPPSDEAELGSLWSQHGRLLSDVAAKTQELAETQNAVAAFNEEYAAVVGRLYAARDELDARIAEALLRRRPGDPVLRSRAHETRAQAVRTAAEAARRSEDRPERVEPTPERRALYIAAAKMFHPDLGSESEQDVRHEFMTRLVRAYERGDDRGIRALIAEWKSVTTECCIHGVAQLASHFRRINARLERTLGELESDLQALRGSADYLLFKQAADARADGRDLIKMLVADLEGLIEGARCRLRSLGESVDM